MSKLWEFYGSNDPYYGVLSAAEYRIGSMDAEARARFFATGVGDADNYISIAENTFGPLNFTTALDYGCGVGRLSRRLTERFRHVISVDISESMLLTARDNLAGRNVTFENASHMGSAQANFILSQMVFQHIPPEEGLEILPKLAARLRGTGIVEMPIRDKASFTWRMLRAGRRTLKALVPIGQPIIPVYTYDHDSVIAVLQNAGCQVVATRFDAPRHECVRVAFHR
jgi:2-polyprenyl-3-methyl-5-hydroxy-6-metoxy-1,4-benzoquinol methylase